jgi:hypothetical protein
MSDKKKCKCGAEMLRSSSNNYIPDCGYVTNTIEYCPVHQEQLSKAMEIGEEAYELLWEATRFTHTQSEVSGPRW